MHKYPRTIYNFILSFIGIFGVVELLGQQYCGTAPQSPAFETWMNQKKTLMKSTGRLGGEDEKKVIYSIPVVVHVIHNGEPIGTGSNLSKKRIVRQIEILTEDFRRLNSDRDNTPTLFRPVAADVQIEFVFAKRDPKGNPTSGIVRKRGIKTSYDIKKDIALIRSENYWNSEEYLNIHVLNLNDFFGFSSLPVASRVEGISDRRERDIIYEGVIVDYEYFGVNSSTSTSLKSLGRTLTHELGHYFGLIHIWGDGNCNVDDFVEDTPLADQSNRTVKSPCTFPNPNDDEICETNEMFQNYMDYTHDECMNLFTIGQRDRMHVVLQNAQRRLSLTTSPALSAPNRFVNDLAITEIVAPNHTECNRSLIPSVKIANYGTNTISNYSIQLFQDEIMVENMSQTVELAPLDETIVYFSPQTISNTPSTFSFVITNVNNTNDQNNTNNSASRVLNHINGMELPFIEDFEGTSPMIFGEIGTNDIWEITNASMRTSNNQALIFKSHENKSAFISQNSIYTPFIDFTGLYSATLSFTYAYATKPNTLYDGLTVIAYDNCNHTFYKKLIFNDYGMDLSTRSPTNTPFVPVGAEEWRNETIDISSMVNNNKIKFVFMGNSGSGNNLYLDNLMITQTTQTPNDASLINLSTPLVTCKEETISELQIINIGSEVLTSFEIDYSINNNSFIKKFENMFISPHRIANVTINIDDLNQRDNLLEVTITHVNGVADRSALGNTLGIVIQNIKNADILPISIQFENEHNWTIVSKNTETLIWESVRINGNTSLVTRGFEVENTDIETWFISPVIKITDLPKLLLSFRVSYAKRMGLNDRLKVLVSPTCGDDYSITLFNAESDSLAVTTIESAWTPHSTNDWKYFSIDIDPTPFVSENELRMAFVFVNGNGNNLYIDDIVLQSGETKNRKYFTAYPIPANRQVNIKLKFETFADITIKFFDMSGKLLTKETHKKAVNQVVNYDSSLMREGIYFVNVSGIFDNGETFSTMQKILIQHR